MFCIYIFIAMYRINFISAFCSYYMCVFCLSSLMLLNMEAWNRNFVSVATGGPSDENVQKSRYGTM